MDKPRGLIWHEPDRYFGMGRLHFGRVSMGWGTLLLAYNIPAALLLFTGMVGYGSNRKHNPDLAAFFGVFGNTGLVLFGIELAIAAIAVIILGIRWVIKDIHIDGPGGH